jgi:hypothetical protein
MDRSSDKGNLAVSRGLDLREHTKEGNEMSKRALAAFLVAGIVSIAWGQTSADLSAKYRPVTSYEVRPGVVMTPSYAADGQVCEMVLEKRQKSENGVVFSTSFSEQEVKDLVDELVPEAERGRNLTKPLNSTVDGGFITTEYTYENVLVHVYGITRPAPSGNRVIAITWPRNGCGGAQGGHTHRN